jgi:hypothetical protein
MVSTGGALGRMRHADLIVLGRHIVRRDQLDRAYARMEKVGTFSGYKAAVQAIQISRRADWRKCADLVLDDEDALALELVMMWKPERGLKEKFGPQNRFFLEDAGEKRWGASEGDSGSPATLADLI